MSAETEVITCPACRHLVRVAVEWLGQPVQCPECRAKFTAPTREGDRLTEAVLLDQPDSSTQAVPKQDKLDVMLLLPAFGLMLVGFASFTVNSWNSVRYASNPDAATQDVSEIVKIWNGRQQEQNAAEGAKTAEQVASELAPRIRMLVALFAVVGAFEFAGGLAMAFRRSYRMAQLACVLASLNLANGCCVPGAVFGLWGLLMLHTDEGRAHFSSRNAA